MLATDLPAYEADFRKTGHGIGGIKYAIEERTIAIPGSDTSMNYLKCRPQSGYTSYYYDETVKKEKIVLHFTAGFLKGDIGALTKPDYHVSVPFLIARDGCIYNLHPSSDWSYHLGKGAVGGNRAGSLSSVGIEMSNIGPLRLVGNSLHSSYGKTYCTTDQTQYYTKLDEPFRGCNYFATFTKQQYQSLQTLLHYLTERYSIPYRFLPQDQRFQTSEANAAFKGIVSHLNFRIEGKWDIGPAFEWQRITQEKLAMHM